MTSSNGNIFRVTGPLCGEFTGPGDFPTQRPVTRSFDVFFDLHLNKGLSKQPWGWWFETPSWSFWRQCNAKPPDARYTVEIKLLCLFHFSKSVAREHWRWLSRYDKFPTKCVIKLITTLIYRNDTTTTIVNMRWSIILRMIEWHTTENYIVI